MSCSRSKCRCITRPDRQGCERCHRLNRPCLPGNSVRKSMAQKSDAMHRIAQLEGKLDGLISTLSASRIVPPGNPHSSDGDPGQHTSPPADSQSLIYPGANTTAETLASFAFVAAPVPQGRLTSISPLDAQTPNSAASDLPADAEECLRTFCGRMVKYFPFVHIPVDVDWMKQNRPFLFLCICAVASRSTQTRLMLGTRIKQIVAQKLILDNHGIIDIDLLFGLLTFLSWGHDALFEGTPTSMSRLAQLAMMVVFELRLNKPPTNETNMLSINGSEIANPMVRAVEHTLEERRAVLGCFYITAMFVDPALLMPTQLQEALTSLRISSYLGQIDGLQWTSYMKESLDILSSSTACPTDRSFALQIRLQLLSVEMENGMSLSTPPHFYISAMQSKVTDIKGTITSYLQNDG